MDLPNEGIAAVVENVLEYLDSRAGEMPRTLVDIVSMNGFAPYNFWPSDVVQKFTHAAMGEIMDRELILSTAKFHVVTRQHASTIPISRSVIHMVALRVWERTLREYTMERELVTS